MSAMAAAEVVQRPQHQQQQQQPQEQQQQADFPQQHHQSPYPHAQPLSRSQRGGSAPLPFPWTLSLLTHAVGVAVVVLLLVWIFGFLGGLGWDAQEPDQVFNFHPLLMVEGLVMVLGEAALMFRVVGGKASANTRKFLHLLLHGVALAMAMVGLLAVLKFHAIRGIPNFYSLHSWLGLATLSAFTVQFVVGYAAFWFPMAAPATRERLHPWHTFAGLMLFVCALASAVTGIVEKQLFRMMSANVDKRGGETVVANLLGLAVMAWGAMVLLLGSSVDKRHDDVGHGDSTALGSALGDITGPVGSQSIDVTK